MEIEIWSWSSGRTFTFNLISPVFTSVKQDKKIKKELVKQGVKSVAGKTAGGVAGMAYTVQDKIRGYFSFDILPISSFKELSRKERKNYDKQLLDAGEETLKEMRSTSSLKQRGIFSKSFGEINLSPGQLRSFFSGVEEKAPEAFKANFGSVNDLMDEINDTRSQAEKHGLGRGKKDDEE